MHSLHGLKSKLCLLIKIKKNKAVMRIRDPQDPHFFESKDPDPHFNADPGSGSWGINLRKNLLKFIAFIADILLMRANLSGLGSDLKIISIFFGQIW